MIRPMPGSAVSVVSRGFAFTVTGPSLRVVDYLALYRPRGWKINAIKLSAPKANQRRSL